MLELHYLLARLALVLMGASVATGFASLVSPPRLRKPLLWLHVGVALAAALVLSLTYALAPRL